MGFHGLLQGQLYFFLLLHDIMLYWSRWLQSHVIVYINNDSYVFAVSASQEINKRAFSKVSAENILWLIPVLPSGCCQTGIVL
jgi:hypothetical protein